MDWFDYYQAIGSFIEGFVVWVQSLPKWGMTAVILIFSGISSRLSLIAAIACGVIVWNVFGMPWGILFFAASAISWLLIIGAACLDNL